VSTRTHTVYFDDEDLRLIREGFAVLESSYLGRKAYMSQAAQRAHERRLDVLRAAWALLLEPVPPSYE
jgi:hypothetical protein